MPNRLSLNDQIEQSLGRHRAGGNASRCSSSISTASSRWNDSLSHDAGDQLLIRWPAGSRMAIHTTDIVARLGSDEFVVLLRDVEGEATPERIAADIITRLAAPSRSPAAKPVGTSIGIALCPAHGSSRRSTAQRPPTEAMYAASAPPGALANGRRGRRVGLPVRHVDAPVSDATGHSKVETFHHYHSFARAAISARHAVAQGLQW